MRPLKILTWHTHGAYLYYLSQLPHRFFVLSKPERPPGYGGRCGHIPWGDNVIDMPVADVQRHEFDCILFQDDGQYLADQHHFLSSSQRALPRIYIEHDTPQGHPTDTRHIVDDSNMLLIHVTHFNALMWDSGRTPVRVIDHGVIVPPGVAYSGERDSGLVVVNHLARRGRRLGVDVFQYARSHIPLDLVGMGAEDLGGIGEVLHAQLPAFAARYRFFFHPVRYTSLGLAVIEAMMVGIPVVSLATTEMVSVIENGVSGYISNDLEALIAGMRDLLRHPGHARDLGRRAQARALERFNIERFIEDWNQALSEVVA